MITGLDVNVKFTSVKDFEYTNECIIFDLLNISLYHGWLVDPTNQFELSSVIQSLSYNQLVEKIISDHNTSEALLAQEFLEDSASQLTYHGLCELHSNLQEDEIAVFFRNNHFSTVVKLNGRILLLVTDQGFLKEPKVVWETLDSVNGDGTFVDDNFQIYQAKDKTMDPTACPMDIAVTQNNQQQIDRDLLLAMTLQEEDDQNQPPLMTEYVFI